MARMLNRTYRKGVCCCDDCGGPAVIGRAAEKRAWTREYFMSAEDVRRIAEGFEQRRRNRAQYSDPETGRTRCD